MTLESVHTRMSRTIFLSARKIVYTLETLQQIPFTTYTRKTVDQLYGEMENAAKFEEDQFILRLNVISSAVSRQQNRAINTLILNSPGPAAAIIQRKALTFDILSAQMKFIYWLARQNELHDLLSSLSAPLFVVENLEANPILGMQILGFLARRNAIGFHLLQTQKVMDCVHQALTQIESLNAVICACELYCKCLDSLTANEIVQLQANLVAWETVRSVAQFAVSQIALRSTLPDIASNYIECVLAYTHKQDDISLIPAVSSVIASLKEHHDSYHRPGVVLNRKVDEDTIDQVEKKLMLLYNVSLAEDKLIYLENDDLLSFLLFELRIETLDDLDDLNNKRQHPFLALSAKILANISRHKGIAQQIAMNDHFLVSTVLGGTYNSSTDVVQSHLLLLLALVEEQYVPLDNTVISALEEFIQKVSGLLARGNCQKEQNMQNLVIACQIIESGVPSGETELPAIQQLLNTLQGYQEIQCVSDLITYLWGHRN